MDSNTTTEFRLTGQDVWHGVKQLLPLALFVTVFGLAFGLAAVQTGLNNATTMLMSALVFAGASQFAVLDMWGAQVPLIPLILTTFAINARHLLMGATLYPWLRHLSVARRYGIMAVASDANWAMAMQAFARGQNGLGILFGGGLVLWLFWNVGSWLGMTFGNVIADPVSLGLDMVMGCFLLAMMLGGERNLRMLAIWAVAAGASLLAYWYMPANSHVVIGAVAGGLFGAFWIEKGRQ